MTLLHHIPSNKTPSVITSLLQTSTDTEFFSCLAGRDVSSTNYSLLHFHINWRVSVEFVEIFNQKKTVR